MRTRLTYASFLGLTILLGLASRKFSFLLPGWLAKNAGDILYATMMFWLIRLLFPRLTALRTAFAAGLFCFGIEFLKFFDVSWLVAAHHSHAGALVFGVGFHASNLVSYLAGAALGFFIEKTIKHADYSV